MKHELRSFLKVLRQINLSVKHKGSITAIYTMGMLAPLGLFAGGNLPGALNNLTGTLKNLEVALKSLLPVVLSGGGSTGAINWQKMNVQELKDAIKNSLKVIADKAKKVIKDFNQESTKDTFDLSFFHDKEKDLKTNIASLLKEIAQQQAQFPLENEQLKKTLQRIEVDQLDMTYKNFMEEIEEMFSIPPSRLKGDLKWYNWAALVENYLYYQLKNNTELDWWRNVINLIYADDVEKITLFAPLTFDESKKIHSMVDFYTRFNKSYYADLYPEINKLEEYLKDSSDFSGLDLILGDLDNAFNKTFYGDNKVSPTALNILFPADKRVVRKVLHTMAQEGKGANKLISGGEMYQKIVILLRSKYTYGQSVSQVNKERNKAIDDFIRKLDELQAVKSLKLLKDSEEGSMFFPILY